MIEAEAQFLRSLECAGQQQVSSRGLRADTSLAPLWQGQGRVRDVRERLTMSYGCFTEGLTTAYLRAAMQLLDQSCATSDGTTH